MHRLSVNVDHVATLRQARRGKEPDPVTAASICELAGADGIIVHLREDRRHIQDRDLRILRDTVKTKLNLEMAAVPEMIEIALEVKPDMATLVPERREELTTEGGLEVNLNKESLRRVIERLREGQICVSLFIDPILNQIKAAHEIGADYIEIHTGRFCEARTEKDQEGELNRILDAVILAFQLKLGINAGHGLDYQNVRKLVPIKEIEEFSIGYSIITRALLVGLERAVRDMASLVKTPWTF